MHSRSQNRPSINFYQHDIVREIGSSDSFGIVLRCWHDVEDNPTQETYSDPMMRPLHPGEVGVSFVRNGGERKILPESELRLVDRTLRPGDFCKRTFDDIQSGVVNNVHIKGRLEHVISGEPVEGWRTANELEPKTQAEIGDFVLYDDWVGQIVELYDESIVEISTGRLVRLPELGSRLNVGEKGNEILPPPSRYNNTFVFPPWAAHNRSDGVDTVIAVQHTAYAITWLAISQMLGPVEAERKSVPKMLWHGEDIGKLTLVGGRVGSSMCVGDRVCLKDYTGAPLTRHGGVVEGETYQVQVFIVVETRTDLEIVWQDGMKETIASTDVIPYLNPDECDCWPGDHVIWKGEGSKHHAIVQSVNAVDRTAQVLLPDTNTIDLASLLELDATGWSDLTAMISPSISEGLGVHRGDFVFIHPEGATNGFANPVVPVIGELEAWVHQQPLEGGGWRQNLAGLGASIAEQRMTGSNKEAPIGHPIAGSGNFAWMGEVTHLNLDGTIEVTLPDLTVKTYPLEQLTKLHNALEHLDDDLWDEEDSESQGTHSDNGWSMDEGEDTVSHSSHRWEDHSDRETERADATNIDSRDWAGESIDESIKIPRSEATSSKTSDTPIDEDMETANQDNFEEGDINWKRFDLLASAPPDHAFISSSPSQPSKVFLSRLAKEYRALSNSLPDSIVVRAYEDRTDLLRSLIIGPTNTPYEDAPFVIDWMLDSNFPNSPPIAHFHSWTSGNGRVNPNLYEEGKVCLSILGTWSGDRDETWSAARSSLLQAFVSIQGLVLVKEPWFCEPAYEKLRGTEEGVVNSRLYNEKVFVLSRAFVRRVLESPVGGLEAETKWFYYRKSHLKKILQDAQTLIEKSQINSDLSEADLELAVPRLTVGGIIALSRTLGRLQALSSRPFS